MPATSWKDLMTQANEGAKEFAPLEPNMYNFVIKDPAKIGQTGKGLPKFSINPSVESGPRANARIWHDFNQTYHENRPALPYPRCDNTRAPRNVKGQIGRAHV